VKCLIVQLWAGPRLADIVVEPRDFEKSFSL